MADRGPPREPEASSSLVVRSIQTHPIGVGFLFPESSRQPELAASTSIGSVEVQGPRGGPRAAPGTGSEFEPRSPLHSGPPPQGWVFCCRKAAGVRHTSPPCVKGAGRRQAAWGIVFPKPLDSGGSPRMGSVIPRREKKFRARRAGFPPRAGTRDSPAGDVVSATGEDERTHTPCGERSAPPSLWGGEAATAHLGRAASAALTQGAPVWGDRSLFNQKGSPLRRAQWGTKRWCRLAGPEKNRRGPEALLPA